MHNYVLTELPRNTKSGHIIWNNVIGMTLEIKYADQTYCMKVVDKNKKNITVQYQENFYNINQDQLLRGGIGKIVGKYTMEYRFAVGDIIEDEYGKIEILSLLRSSENHHGRKLYRYRCLKCGYTGIVSELKLYHKHTRCQVCCKNAKMLYPGINTLGSVFPHITLYLFDKDDADRYLPKSTKKIRVKCPNCGDIRLVTVYKLVQNGFICPNCYSADSYPNKLMKSILQHLDVNFESERVFAWSNKKRYDFFLPDYNSIIEMHGSGHYIGIYDHSAESIQNNDKEKRDLALKNGVQHYIEIDCKKEDLDYIKNSIMMHGQLNKIINVDSVNFEQCDYDIDSDITKDILVEWEKYRNIPKISKNLRISNHIIRKRLKICAKLGLVNYDPNEQNNSTTRKAVYDKDYGIRYNSISECASAMQKSRGYIRLRSDRFIVLK